MLLKVRFRELCSAAIRLGWNPQEQYFELAIEAVATSRVYARGLKPSEDAARSASRHIRLHLLGASCSSWWTVGGRGAVPFRRALPSGSLAAAARKLAAIEGPADRRRRNRPQIVEQPTGLKPAPVSSRRALARADVQFG